MNEPPPPPVESDAHLIGDLLINCARLEAELDTTRRLARALVFRTQAALLAPDEHACLLDILNTEGLA
jgi:hypothetical protein